MARLRHHPKPRGHRMASCSIVPESGAGRCPCCRGAWLHYANCPLAGEEVYCLDATFLNHGAASAVAGGYSIKAKGAEAEIYLYGDVGDSWFGGVTAKQFA